MPRRVQDIVPNGRRTIRDIPTHREEERPRTREKVEQIKIHKPAHDKVIGNLISLETETPQKAKRNKQKT